MNKMLLHCEAPFTNNGFIRRSCVVERQTDGKITSQDTLWIEMPPLTTMPPEDDAEPFMLMALLPAMAENRELQVEGAVSARLLSNLTEFRDIWHSLNPRHFYPIEFSSSQLLKWRSDTGREEAVAAFSGGLDSSFTVWRHKSGSAGLRSFDLRLTMMVHGFDVPLWKVKSFELIYHRFKGILGSLNIPLVPLRTNCREVFTLNWEIWNGLALVVSHRE